MTDAEESGNTHAAMHVNLSDKHKVQLDAFRSRLAAAVIEVPKLSDGGGPDAAQSVRNRQEKLPTVLTNVHECDVRLVQFLRSRDFNVDEALQFYIEDRVWREQMAVDGILDEKIDFEEEIAELWPVCFPGHDKFGRPMLFENTGDMDIIKLCEKKKISVDTLMRFHIKQQEYMRALAVEASDRFKKVHDSLFIVMDLEHATLKSHLNKYSRELFAALADVDQNHYPETIGKLILINSSPPVAFAWNFVKPFLNPVRSSSFILFVAHTCHRSTCRIQCARGHTHPLLPIRMSSLTSQLTHTRSYRTNAHLCVCLASLSLSLSLSLSE